MIRQVRRLGIAMLVLYGALFAQLNWIQVVRADHYNHAAGNVRSVKRDFDRPRGQIISADGTVLARPGPGAEWGSARSSAAGSEPWASRVTVAS